MLLWFLFAVVTALAAIVILSPYWLRGSTGAVAVRDVDFYKQQLKEIEGERAAGLLGEDEAKAAQIEVSRRLIAATEAAERSARQGTPTAEGFPAAGYAVVAALVVIGIGGYMGHGSPDLPEQPLASRTQQPMTLQTYINKVEKQLKKQPKDGAGWEALGMLYSRGGRFQDAAGAYRKAVDILGENADRLANLGEAMALAANGNVSPEIRAVLEKALAQDGANPKANFLVALADEQAGKLPEAVERYKRILAGDLAEENREVLRKRVAALEAELNGGGQTARGGQGAGGGDQASQSAAEAEMIAGMVNKLAERLKKDGSDLKGWLMLVRAYTVLGRKDDALQAVTDAKGNFKGNEDALGQIDALARSLGLTS